eukprot:1151391-Pelagomonas_calceolata.AAC.8
MAARPPGSAKMFALLLCVGVWEVAHIRKGPTHKTVPPTLVCNVAEARRHEGQDKTGVLKIGPAQDWGPTALRVAQRAGAEEIGGGLNLLEAAVVAVDGEKDPRCLLASFQLLQVRTDAIMMAKAVHAAGCFMHSVPTHMFSLSLPLPLYTHTRARARARACIYGNLDEYVNPYPTRDGQESNGSFCVPVLSSKSSPIPVFLRESSIATRATRDSARPLRQLACST